MRKKVKGWHTGCVCLHTARTKAEVWLRRERG
jgi:hypothetical protein